MLLSPKKRTFSRTQTLVGSSAEDLRRVREMDAKVAKKLLEEEKRQIENRRTLFGFPVKHGISRANLVAVILVPLCMMLLSTYVNAQLIFLLTNPEYFGVADEDEGKISGKLISYSLPGAMVATFFVGYIYDILGRKWTLFLSFALTSVLVLFVPYTSPVIWPTLFLIRGAIAIATVPPICSPLLADYV